MCVCVVIKFQILFVHRDKIEIKPVVEGPNQVLFIGGFPIRSPSFIKQIINAPDITDQGFPFYSTGDMPSLGSFIVPDTC